MDYRERFELQEQRATQNDKGDSSVNWVTVYAAYARVANLGSREYWQAAAVNAESTLKFFCRYHPALDMADTRKVRLLWRGKPLDIKSIDNSNFQNEQMVIKAVMKDE